MYMFLTWKVTEFGNGGLFLCYRY